MNLINKGIYNPHNASGYKNKRDSDCGVNELVSSLLCLFRLTSGIEVVPGSHDNKEDGDDENEDLYPADDILDNLLYATYAVYAGFYTCISKSIGHFTWGWSFWRSCREAYYGEGGEEADRARPQFS